MARRIVGIKVERRLVTVPVAGPAGCTEFTDTDCCSGSGSGSGSGDGQCVLDCPQCPTGTSVVWTATVPGFDSVDLFHDSAPDDGNYCSWVSDGRTWRLYFDGSDPAAEVWLLVNYDTEQVWFLGTAFWDCNGTNELLNTDGSDTATLEPVYDCATVTYNCVAGSCEAVAGTGGAYATLAECQAACTGGDPVAACGCATVPRTLYAHFTGALAGLGTVTLFYDTGSAPAALTWKANAPVGTCLGSSPIISFVCAPGLGWTLTSAGLTGAFFTSGAADFCAPFSWIGSGTATGTCAGAFLCTVDETP